MIGAMSEAWGPVSETDAGVTVTTGRVTNPLGDVSKNEIRFVPMPMSLVARIALTPCALVSLSTKGWRSGRLITF